MNASRWNTELFPTQLVGSWVKPQWLADHDKVYGKEGTWWRVPEAHLASALDDAARLAIEDQNRAGLTYATDGEARRQTFSGHFNGLGGIDSDHPAEFTNFHNDITAYLTMRRQATNVGADPDKVKAEAEREKEPEPDQAKAPPPPPKILFPAVRQPVHWPGPMVADELHFLKRFARNRCKVTVVGPVTLSYRVVDTGVYADHAALCFAIADALNRELHFLSGAGADLIQIDEPEVHFRYSQCREFAVEAINRTVRGVDALTQVHVCYGYSRNIAFKAASPVYPEAVGLIARSEADAMHAEYAQPGHTPEFLASVGDKPTAIGVLNLDPESEVETADGIVRRVEDAMQVVPKERIGLAPDCGMWFLERDFACRKLDAMRVAAERLRDRFH